jgi:hypothetical protein
MMLCLTPTLLFGRQQVVERYGHVASLTGSLVLSIVPLLIFGCFMPETLGKRGSVINTRNQKKENTEEDNAYVQLEYDEIMQTRTLD